MQIGSKDEGISAPGTLFAVMALLVFASLALPQVVVAGSVQPSMASRRGSPLRTILQVNGRFPGR